MEKIHKVALSQWISLFLFIFINSLFCFKYLSRLNVTIAFLIVFSYFIIISILACWYNLRSFFSNKIINAFLIISYLGLFFILYKYIPQECLNVDRWSVIASFWNAVMDGQYPYYAKSNFGNYPGPMPIYYILAFPFYIVGELGLYSVAGLALLFYFFYKHGDRDCFTFVLYLIVSSCAIFWELFTKSTILVNSMLIFILIFYLKDIDKMNSKEFWISAVVGGLLLSTRSVFALVFLLWCFCFGVFSS